MTIKHNQVSVTYTDTELRNLVEEYITQQNSEFTLKGTCSYVLYWAKEEGKTVNTGLYESNQLDQEDCDRLIFILKKIIGEGRLTAVLGDDDTFADESEFTVV